MNDNDIIKALEYCVECGNCATCMYKSNCIDLPQDILNLVVRQKAEIERLKLTYSLKIGEVQEHYRNQIGRARAEAIKEFAERFSEKLGKTKEIINICVDGVYESLADIIDNLVKEMTEDQE